MKARGLSALAERFARIVLAFERQLTGHLGPPAGRVATWRVTEFRLAVSASSK
jgi:hypothetical protein